MLLFYHTYLYIKKLRGVLLVMPYITVKMLEGRSEEQKRALVEKVTNAVSETVDAPKEKIVVFIEEMSKSNYGIGGKRLNDQ
jgi:4-oxalocrotonate tautomerase